jgi:hypothetical protein
VVGHEQHPLAHQRFRVRNERGAGAVFALHHADAVLAPLVRGRDRAFIAAWTEAVRLSQTMNFTSGISISAAKAVA